MNEMMTRDPYEIPSQIECPTCDSRNITTTNEVEAFTYGKGDDTVELTAEVQVHRCLDCNSQFTGSEAEDARHNAVCKHLGVMTPAQVLSIRNMHTMSAAAFANLTGLGTASLSRWENGLLIQNKAYDTLLFLLTFSENIEHLLRRTSLGTQPAITSYKNNDSQFKIIEPNEKLEQDAAAFELTPTLT